MGGSEGKGPWTRLAWYWQGTWGKWTRGCHLLRVRRLPVSSLLLVPGHWPFSIGMKKKKCTICEYEWPLDPEIYIQAFLKAHVVIPSHTIYVNFFYFVEKGSPVVTPIIMYESKIISWPKKKIRFPPEWYDKFSPLLPQVVEWRRCYLNCIRISNAHGEWAFLCKTTTKNKVGNHETKNNLDFYLRFGIRVKNKEGGRGGYRCWNGC